MVVAELDGAAVHGGVLGQNAHGGLHGHGLAADSPTSATVSPLYRSMFTPRMACTGPAVVLK